MTIQRVLLQTLPCVMTGSIVTHYLDDGDTTNYFDRSEKSFLF